MTLIKDYHKPERVSEIPDLMKLHLESKYEKKKAILTLEHDDRLPEYFGVNDKIVLTKSIEFYSNKKGIKSVFWFYLNELK